MTLLERVIRGHRCRSTHHFIAFDALSLIEGDSAEGWKSLMLVHHEHLLKGAKAPDDTFKDFKNHVLHVGEGEWGGARAKAAEWYAISVDLLRRKRWSDAAWAFGVLSHYYADPIQPFHTGQTEAENVIHRAVEWSIAKSRADTDARIAKNGYPEVEVPEGLGFVSDMVRIGALRSHAYYDVFIGHYDLDAGVSDPPSGLDETMRAAIADLVSYATAGFAKIMTRAIEEAAVAPPKVHLILQGYIETLDIPLRWITAKLEDMGDRAQVEKMYKEFQKTGKVIRALPEDDKAVREMHAKEVRRISMKTLNAEPIQPIGTERDGNIQSILEGADAGEAEHVVEEEVVTLVEEIQEVDVVEEAAAEEADIEEADVAAEDEAELSEDDDAEEFEDGASGDDDLEEEIDDAADEDFDDEDVGEEDEYEAEAEYEDDVEDDEEEFDAEAEDFEDEEDDEQEFDAEADEEASTEEGLDEEDEAAPPPAIVAPVSASHRRASLTFESPVVEAPSIGPKTAAYLAKAGIETVGDLIICDPDETAELVDVRYISVDAIETWQMQATLMMEVPGLRVHDVQLLVGAGISSREDLANASATTIFELAMEFLQTSEGSRVLRPGETLEEDEVEEWIELAQDSA
ncbi:DUF4332 domain-containing protein [Hyphomonas sp. WL0036]|uniref:DUF4332 domain-containing protein n=1 Tax=Hyphomonas sediminis TaxID=2866160 RepID=UPI001C7E1E8B|nr:DUF4332 domain-containing protein [Hyphomonas sediminis]MBY9068466.1 DUF4332 domain-containing protein [Hyphomonas sediminis]